MQAKGKIFVTDGRSLAALAIVRSFGEKGFEVHCGEEFRLNVTSFSKYVKQTWKYPSPESEPEEFIEAIDRITKQEKFDMIIPVRDAATYLIAKYTDDISRNTNVYLANYNLIRSFQDKAKTTKIAHQYGVPYPNTYYPEEVSFKELKAIINFPVLIKPRVSSGSRGIIFVESPDDLERSIIAVERDYGEPIIQEYISHKGGHFSIGTLFDRMSKPLAVHVYEEVKQYPVKGGPAVVAKSVPKGEWVNAFLRMLEKVGWVGPAHMDVLYDISTGTYKLLEVNPRFWMSLNLTIRSGVDIPFLLYQIAHGKEVEFSEDYNTKMGYRWVFPNEILWLLSTPDKKQGIIDFFALRGKDVCYGDLSMTDPLPCAGILAQSMHFLTDKTKRQSFFNRGW